MEDKNPFADPNYGMDLGQQADANPFSDPNYGKPSSLTRRVLSDGGISLLKGAISVPEAAVGLADIATGGIAGKAAEGIGFRPQEAKQILDSYLTPEQQQANRIVQQAKGFVDTLGAVADNPSTIPHAVAESLPLMGAGGVIGRGIAAVAPKASPLLAGAIGEGATMAGSAAEQIRQQTGDGLLTPKQSLAAAGTGVAGAALGAAGAKAGKAMGLGDVDTALVSGTLGTSGRSMPVRIGGNAMSEGLLEEMPQSAAEQVLQNYALDNDLGEGVGNASAMGLVTGGAMGGAFGAISGRRQAEQGAADQPAAVSAPNEPPPLVVNRGADSTDLIQPTPTAENPAPAPVERPDPSNGPLSAAASMLPSATLDVARIDQQIGRDEALPELQQDQPGSQGRKEQSAPASPEEARIREAIADVERRARLAGMTPVLAAERARLGGELLAMQQSAEEAQRAKPVIGDQRSDFYTASNGFTSRDRDPWVNPANNRSSDPYDRFPGIDQVPPQPLEGELLTDALGEPPGQPAGQPGIGADSRPRLMREGELMGGEVVPQGQRAGLGRGDTFDGQNRAMPTQPDARGMTDAVSPRAIDGELVGGDLQAQAERQRLDGRIIEGELSPREQRALTTTFRKRGAAELARKSLPAPDRYAVEEQDGAFAIRQLPPPVPSIAGREIDGEWSEFASESGTLAIPRAEMPQIKAEHRGAMVNFLNARGIQHEEQTVSAAELKPTQAEFSREKVAQAKGFAGGDRAILVSSDGHVLDGHHQWLAKREAGGDVRVIRLKAPIRDLLPAVAEFPSATQDAGAQPMTIGRPPKAPKRGQRRTVDRDRDSVIQAVIRLGGITTQWKQDTTGDTVGNKNIPGVGALWSNKTGTSLDDMASLLDQHGYVPAGEMDQDGGVSWLQAAIRAELSGQPHYAPDSARQIELAEQELLNRYAEDVARAIDQREAEYARIEAEYGPDAADDARSFDQAAIERDAQLDREIADAEAQQDTYLDGDPLDAAAAARRDDELRQTDGRADRAERAEADAFALHQQTEAELAEQARQQAEREKAEAKAQAEAGEKARKESERAAAKQQNEAANAEFTLGQDAEQNLSGQRGMFDEAPTAEQPAAKPAADQPTPPAKPKAKRSKPAAERPAESKIEDFGERLEGARKFNDYKQKLDAAKDLDVAAVPLSKSWPVPDYQELLDAGSDPWGVAFMRAAREEIANKPSKGYKFQRWVEQVKGLRETAMRAASEPAFAERVRTKAMTEFASLQGLIGRADLYAEFGHEVALKGISFRSHHYSVYRGENDVTKWVVEGKPEKSALSNWPKELAVGNTREEAMTAFAAKHAGMKAKPNAEVEAGPSVRFDVYTDRTTRKSFIAKKNGKRLVRMQEFDSVREALDYLKNNQAALEARYEAMKAPPPTRNEDNAPRIGADHRNGQDVTPELFGETFGFRGVQFGNYVENKRRIKDLNDAYDGLMDLAGILNMPPRALSLNGELGLAFGARGTGGPDPAKAHYERDSVVINLTKTNGAGSLAHEWWHALDNYLSRSRGELDDFLTDKPYPTFAKGTRTPLDGVRPELLAAFKELNQAVGRTRMKQRAEELDKMRTKDYWSTTVEMTARAFESYVINKLDGHGVRSDYLANIISEEGFNREEAYPYPTAAEIPVIRAAFDNIFSVIETRTDDAGNVALYSLDDADSNYRMGAPAKGIPLMSARRIAAKFQRQGVKVEAVTTPADLPPHIFAGIQLAGVENRVRGLYHRATGTSYIIASNLRDANQAVGIVLHEAIGHGGIKQLLGDRLPPVMRDIFNSIPETERLRMMRNYQAQVKASRMNQARAEQLIAEEYVAHLAETDPQNSMLDKLVAMLRNWIRENFGDRIAVQWTRNDLVQLLAEARRQVAVDNREQDRQGGLQSAMAFSLDDGAIAKQPASRDRQPDIRFNLAGIRLKAGAVADAIAAAPELAGIKVVQSFVDLPLAVRTRVERDGVAPRSVRGVFRPDGQYLVADNLDSVDEAVHTAVHEMVGHLGVRGVLGRELDATLERIYSSEVATTKGRQRIAQIREAYAAPLGQRSAAGQRLMVAEEIIAHLAESGDRPGVLQRFVSKVRAALRRLFPQVRWTYNDILGLIEQSRKWLQRERAASVNQAGDDNLYSLAAEPDTGDALRKLGLAGEEAAGMLDRIRNLTQADLKGVLGAWATRSREGLFDGLDGIRRAEEAVGVTDADQQGYVSARMASGIADVMHGVLHYGAPEWRDGVVSYKAGTRGVLEILGDLGPSNLNSWLGWLGGKRGQLLKAEGRENNLTDADIAELLAMANGKEALFGRVYREYAQVNEAVLDLAEKAGLIDAEARAKWATEYYVPFYRQQEGDEGLFSAPRTKRGLSHQTAAIKALKGGKLPTNDLLGNMMAGWTKRIDAAMKNKALLEVVDNLKGSDYLTDESPRYQQVLITRSQIAAQIRQDRKALRLAAQLLGLEEGAKTLKVLNELMKPQNEGFEKLWTRVAPTDPDIIRVQRAGKNEYYRVNDESLLRGLKFMAGSTFNDPITKIGRAFKRILTTGVTASPDFILRNFIRDAAHAWMINKDGFVLGKDSIRGMRDALREDQAYRDLMFAGGSFQGGYVHGADPEASAQIIRRALEKKGFTREQQEAYVGSLVNTPAKAAAMLKKGWQKYRELGDKVENANRLSTYKAALAAGKSKRQAAFEAKDLMDYSLRGNFAAAQWFTDVVPFLNARLQGLYKLGRAVKGDKGLIAREVAMKGAYIALFSLLLAGLNDDDERYQALQDWDKDMHWHIFLGEEHFRIPKPFELGLIFGTVPERLLHALTGSQDGEDLAKAVSHGVFQTLAFNPVPQFYQPIRELQANRNFFRDMPIEDMADEGKLPEARYDERTSALSRTLGQLTGPVAGLSPKQLDHLVMGYTGTLGGYVLSMSNLIAGAFSDAVRPALNAGDVPVLKVLYQGDAVRSTQYQTELYDMLQEAEQLHRTIRSYREEGKLEQAAMLLEANRDQLRHRPALGLARKQLGNIRQKMDRVYRETGMDAAAKRVRLDDLQRQANGIAERVSRLAGADF